MLAAYLWYGLAWLSFGALHSVLAAESVKSRLHPLTGRYYRLAYNAFAALHIGAVWLFGRYLFAGAPSFPLPRPIGLAGDAVSLLGAAILAFALTGYDRGRFLGTRQIRVPDEPEDEPLRVDGLHRYVRHPLYSGAFLVLWGQAQGEFALATAVWGSLYLLIGTAFEERRLVARYGDAYRDYRSRVPAFIPWRGRAVV